MTKSGCQTERGKIHNILYLDSPKLAGCAFANFGNSSGTEEEPSQKREKNGRKKKKNQRCLERESNQGPVDN